MQEPIDVNAVEGGKHPETLLSRALKQDDDVLIPELLARGADPNVRVHDMYGLTPTVHLALQRRSPDVLSILQLMKDHGADLNLPDARGANALHAAVGENCETIVFEWLIEQGADVQQKDLLGRTPTHWAAGSYGRARSLPPLIAAGGSLITHDAEGFMPGQTSLGRPGEDPEDYRVEVWFEFVVLPLANAGRTDELDAQLNAAGNVRAWRSRFDDFDLLQFATERGSLICVRALLDYGFDVNRQTDPARSRTHGGSTALHIAAGNLRDPVTRALLEAGADPTLRNAEGMTPADRARAIRDHELADEIESYIGR